MSNELKVAVCEMTSLDDVDQNFAQIKTLLSHLENPNSYQLVCFPENALAMRLSDKTLPSFTLDHPGFLDLAKWAKAHGCALHIGSVALDMNGVIYNASILIRADGSIETPYQKIHLFDVDVKGEKRVAESDSFRHGKDSSVFEIDGWKFGSSICYDVRFSELYARYAALEVDAILVPAAFLVTTGQAHWEILLRARAIENQCYVLAAAQGGEHKSVNGVRQTYGHSLAIDPWGVKLGEVLPGSAPGSTGRILTATLKRDRINEVRRQIPMKSHRRL